ncbi:hypothetical protein NIES4101_31030 [Calothrix sp. NIES-4101]|nr:hypothetical protein NIES4101_31030 [Calothrix sp. NIES-4101]
MKNYLEEAVKTYWLFKTNNQETAPTEHQIFLIKCYLEHYINAPCWQEDSKINLQKLRSTVSSINSIDDIHAWLKNAMEIALDPL